MKALIILFLLGTLNAQAGGGSWQVSVPRSVEVAAVPPGTSVTPLLKVSTDRGPEVYMLGLLRDGRGAAQGLYMDTGAVGTPYSFAEIAMPAGVTLFESSGRKVLLLQGQGGRLHLRYLTNGLFGTYASCDVLLQSRSGQYWMQNAYTGQKVVAARVITSALGVSTIQGICPGSRR